MVDKRTLEEAWFDFPSYCRVMEYGESFDAMWGCSAIEIGGQEIEALKAGKVLYFEDGEYAMLIRMAERKEK